MYDLNKGKIRKYNTLLWRHNGHNRVSNHQPYDNVLNRLFRRRSKKTSKFRVTDLCAGNSPWPVNSPHKWSVTRKMFPFDDVIMFTTLCPPWGKTVTAQYGPFCPRGWYDRQNCDSVKPLLIRTTMEALKSGIPNCLSTEHAEVNSSKHSQ